MKKQRLYGHPAYRLANGLFALGPLSALIAGRFPSFRNAQAVITICVAFLGPFLIIYSAARSGPRKMGEPLITFLVTMIILVMSYADVYQHSGLVIDTTAKPEPRAITSYADAVYFSAVTWTTLGYGDLEPQGFCRIVAASEAFVGYIFLGSLIALLFSFLTETRQDQNV